MTGDTQATRPCSPTPRCKLQCVRPKPPKEYMPSCPSPRRSTPPTHHAAAAMEPSEPSLEREPDMLVGSPPRTLPSWEPHCRMSRAWQGQGSGGWGEG